MRLPPDSDSIHQHLIRANYLAYMQRHFNLVRHPSPIGNGWQLIGGLCLPIRSTKPALPASISLPIDKAEKDSDSESDSDSEQCASYLVSDDSSENSDDDN